MIRSIAIMSLFSLAPPVFASPNLRIANGQSARLVVQNRRQAGTRVRAGDAGWRLEVSEKISASVELRDVTAGAPPMKWTVPLEEGTLLLDDKRFVAGHAYRVEFRRGSTVLGRALVYLEPPARRASSRIEIDRADTTDAEDTELHVVPKGEL